MKPISTILCLQDFLFVPLYFVLESMMVDFAIFDLVLPMKLPLMFKIPSFDCPRANWLILGNLYTLSNFFITLLFLFMLNTAIC